MTLPSFQTKLAILGVALALMLAASWALFAQAQAERVVVVNSDGAVEKYKAAQEAFRETLGKPVKAIDIAKMSDAAAERAIRAEAPTAVYCIGARAFLASSRAARGRPIVMSSAINWQRLPGSDAAQTHIIANELSSEAQLTMFRYFFPEVKRVGVLYSAEFNRQWIVDAAAAGRNVGVEVIGVSVRSAQGAPSELSHLLPRVDALWITADPVVLVDETAARALFAAAAVARKPVFTYASAFAELSPTLIVAPDVATIGRQAAGLLQGLGPGAKKQIESPAGSEVILNLRAVQEYGLELNNEAMDSVNRLLS